MCCPIAALTIVATGPLTAASLADSIAARPVPTASPSSIAIAPIVHRDSIDMSVCWMAARWDKGGKDYINCPMDKEQYLAFHQGLLDGEKGEFKEWEANTPYFEGCMPIEVMAERGVDTLRLWADEAGRTRQPALGNARASQRPLALMRSCSSGRTTSSARCGTWSASRPS
jgi:tRNA:m(5)U-54 methyltransferase